MNNLDKLKAKVEAALKVCFEADSNANNGRQTYSFKTSEFASGLHIFENDLKMINVILRDNRIINLYGRYAAVVARAQENEMHLILSPVADREDWKQGTLL